MSELLDRFSAAVSAHPSRLAIIDGKGRETSFGELNRKANAFAARWQAQGIGRGDRVLLAQGVGAELYASLAALWSLGATVVLPEPALGIAGLRHAARVTRPKAFCASGAYVALRFLLPELWRPALLRTAEGQSPSEPVEVDPEDIALISFTSGTTGLPKAIPRSHGFLAAQYRAVAPILASSEQERDLVAFPVFVLINLAEARTSVLPNWRTSRIAQVPPDRVAGWMDYQNVTRALIPPSVCGLLARAERVGSLHAIFTGGGPVFPDLLDRLSRAQSAAITCVYGSTEAEPIAHLDASFVADADRTAMKNGRGLLVGRPVDDIEVRVVEDEIQVTGPHVNLGYLDPAHDAENKVDDGRTRWHRTGDAGLVDEEGRLWLLGRVGSDVPASTGRLYPFSVEVAVRMWPGVRQCALMTREGVPLLVIEGDRRRLSKWRGLASDIGIAEVEHVATIPMDRRHHSKVDRAKLREMLSLI